ncbi:MAG: DMT family transporter [Melioribacteraceae bacterium]|nr:DMT family transporter [Melioribacteraceae bacterium]MDD3559313.1 DMT family transporter [Melioribacteraceae bacterium]
MENRTHIKPILQALLVTLLWSSSFIIIKLGLDEIPPILFAGLRYILAFIILLIVSLSKQKFEEVKSFSRKDWINLIALGIVFYTLTQGAQFLGLSLLPSVTVSLMLNFTPIVVAVLAIFFLKEFPSIRQWFGTILFLAGVLVYFLPLIEDHNPLLGIIIMAGGILSNAGAAVLGRNINRTAHISPLIITTISMGIGSVILFTVGAISEGIPSISFTNILLLLWLAVINTAFAFTLWNVTLQKLTAMESSIINGTMLFQIAFLAWIILGESITMKEGVGIVIAALGAVLVQLKKKINKDIK